MRNLELEEGYVELRAEVGRDDLDCLLCVVERGPERRDAALVLRPKVPRASEVGEDLGVVLAVF